MPACSLLEWLKGRRCLVGSQATLVSGATARKVWCPSFGFLPLRLTSNGGLMLPALGTSPPTLYTMRKKERKEMNVLERIQL